MIHQIRGLQKVDLANLFGRNEADIFASIGHIEATYPGFDNWLHSKVLPGIRDGSRRAMAVIVDHQVQAIAIAKKTEIERKLCTLWVDPSVRTCGYANELAIDAFDWLGTNTPLFTVPDTRIVEFGTLLSRWGFTLTQVVDGAYRPGCPEFVFNGLLRSAS